MKSITKVQQREKRHARVRARVIGSSARPRLSIFKSNTRVVAQLIDDEKGVTIAAVSSDTQKGGTPRERAEAAAVALAAAAREKGVKAVVFDRGGFLYSGTVSAFADAARAAGLEF
ncbi:MAG TPA: 50S ribosomal protein L18 [Candidatus Paceibacterota bacterium]|nr:50S ribosomal protein L18 [Candidatus Paceibacterota bacterium]